MKTIIYVFVYAYRPRTFLQSIGKCANNNLLPFNTDYSKPGVEFNLKSRSILTHRMRYYISRVPIMEVAIRFVFGPALVNSLKGYIWLIAWSIFFFCLQIMFPQLFALFQILFLLLGCRNAVFLTSMPARG
jgi:hypothetical protein